MLLKKDKLLFNNSIAQVANVIFTYPNKVFHLRMLERKTKLSTTAVSKAILELSKNNIIKIEKTSITTNISANLDSDDYYFYKKLLNLSKIKLLIQKLIDIFQNPYLIVLFGSFAKAEDIEESDIDILILSDKKYFNNLEKTLVFFEKKLKRKINLHILSSFDESSKEFKNTIANGIILHGYLKVV